MNYKTRVATTNPVAFTTINNMLQNQRLAHAFLFSAAPGQPIENEPWYLIERLIDNPKLTSLQNYVDLVVLTKTKTVITKEEVLAAIEKLQQTALVPGGKKILFIQNVENGNHYSLNALLKFIEEPASNTYIIMTTNHISRVLMTIRSRAQTISVRALARAAFASNLQRLGIKNEKSAILASVTNAEDEAVQLSTSAEFDALVENISKALEHAQRRPQRLYTELGPLITPGNYLLATKLLNTYFGDVWRAKINLPVVFHRERGVLQNYAHSAFNYDKALIIINDFTLGQEKNFNFELAKNRMLVELEGAYE